MKRKTVALMTALTLVFSLSACGDKTAPQAEIPDTTGVEEIAETPEEAEVTEEESTPEEEPTPEISPEEKVQSALGEMPYYGDTASCKMTAEQATAFAQLIADGLAGDFSFRGGYDERVNVRFDIVSWSEPYKLISSYGTEPITENDRAYVMLADFAGDGKPYLYVYSSLAEGSFEVYGWADDNAKLAFHAEDENNGKGSYKLYEDDSDGDRMKMLYTYEQGIGNSYEIYSFSDGTIEKNIHVDVAQDVDGWHILYEDDTEVVYTEEEYQALLENNHSHTLPYTCFYDMTPCTLEEMVNYLNTYASAMSDGQSVPVEVKKVDIVKHDGTGITTKGEVSRWKVDSLEILRQYMVGENGIAGVDDGDSWIYANEFGEQWEGSKNFYFALTDINNDGNQDLKVSYKEADKTWSITNLYLGSSFEEILPSINGANLSEGTYLCTGGSVFAVARLYVYDGTTFSVIRELNEAEDYKYSLTENGETQEISEEEFNSIWADWESKNTDISADIHLDIENIENTFQVKIDIQSSGEWLVTSVE